MSETLRVYTRNDYKPRRKKNGLLRRLLGVLFFFLAIILGLVLWISEDSHKVEEFLPATNNFQLFFPNLMQNYGFLINSQLWKFLDDIPELAKIKKFLGGQQGIPVWVVRHLICDFLYFSAEDLGNVNSYLVIIKLSRLGCVLETLYSYFWDGVEYDWAGGIGIYHSRNFGICHTRKGRVVILSKYRENVIKAVTKAPTEKTSLPVRLSERENYEGIVAYGMWKPSFSIKGIEISDSTFSFSSSNTEIHLNAEVKLDYTKADEPWIALLSELVPGQLKLDNSESLLFLSAYTSIPCSTWIKALDSSSASLDIQENTLDNNMQLTRLLREVFKVFENNFSIWVDSFYTDEIIPFIPRFAIGGKVSISQGNKEAFERIFSTPVIFLGEPQKFRPGKKPGEYLLSLIGSSQTDLVFSISEDNFIISNADEMKQWAYQLLSRDDNTPTLQGNFLLKLKPNKLAENISKSLEPLLASKVIQIRDEEKYNTLLTKMRLIDSIFFRVSFDHSLCKLTAHINLALPQ